ncbi:MAG: hypothetical protein ACRDJJ_02010 [Actinomycetota bacterium]
MSTNPVDRFIQAVETAGFADTDVFADEAVSDTTVPNWRLQVHGAPELRAQYAKWFDHPAELAEVRRTPLPDGELLEYTRTWTQDGVPHKGHHVHRFSIVHKGSSRTPTGAAGERHTDSWPTRSTR